MNRNSDKLPFKFLGIKPSPKINDYHNKCEFAIGKNMNGEITVGFRLGNYADGELGKAVRVNYPPLPAFKRGTPFHFRFMTSYVKIRIWLLEIRVDIYKP